MTQQQASLAALAALSRRRFTAQGLGDPVSDALAAVFPQIKALIDHRAAETKAAALAEIDKKGSEASSKALVGGFLAGLIGAGVGIGVGFAIARAVR